MTDGLALSTAWAMRGTMAAGMAIIDAIPVQNCMNPRRLTPSWANRSPMVSSSWAFSSCVGGSCKSRVTRFLRESTTVSSLFFIKISSLTFLFLLIRTNRPGWPDLLPWTTAYSAVWPANSCLAVADKMPLNFFNPNLISIL